MSMRRVLPAVVGALLIGALVLTLVRNGSLSTHDQTQVRSAAVSLLEADLAVGRLPDALAERRQVVAAQSSQRHSALERIWVPTQVESRVEEWDDGLALVASDPTYDAYFRNRLSVTSWEDARETSDGVRVTFTGHMDYLGNQWSGWSHGPLTRYRVKLERATSGGDWLLADSDEDVLVAP